VSRRFGTWYQFHLHGLDAYLVHEDGTDTRFPNVDSLNSDAGFIPKRKHSILFVCFVWAYNLEFHSDRGKKTEGAGEDGAEKNIWH
jgi:hypothetical protein